MAHRYRSLADYFEQTGKHQRELADRLGLHVSAISRYVSGQREPSLRQALAIVKATGIPIESLVSEAA